ncbi:MAG: DUF6056 family protein [Erysipelotrichaceae bacterium]
MYLTNKKKNKEKWTLMIIIFLMVLPILMIAIYNRPVADDYDYTYLTAKTFAENGFDWFKIIASAWQTNMSFYNNWQGLYTSAFLLSLAPNIFGEQFYGLGTYIIVLFMFICTYIFTSILSNTLTDCKNKVVNLFVAFFLTFVFIQCMPSYLEGLFWYNGAANYIPFAFLNFIVWSLLFKIYLLKEVKHKSLLILLTTIMSFVISGGNHVTAFANILFLFSLSILFIIQKRKEIFPPLVSAIIGFVIVMIAPGTAIRSAALGHNGNVFISIIAALYKSLGVINGWINLSFILFLIVMTPILYRIVKENKFNFSFKYPLLLVIAEYLFISAMYSIPFYSMGGFGEGRIYNVIWITFIFLSIIAYAYFLGWLSKKTNISLPIIKFKHLEFVLTLSCILFMGIYGSTDQGLTFIAVTELISGEAKAFSVEMDARIALYNDDSLTEVGVSPIINKGTILYFGDLSSSTEEWVNASISEYYGKKIYLLVK